MIVNILSLSSDTPFIVINDDNFGIVAAIPALIVPARAALVLIADTLANTFLPVATPALAKVITSV